MEYLPGGTLKDRLMGQHMPWQDSFHLLLPIARALQFSHQQGIIHRDVKPSNILITLSGEPMLSDFGIAKILESEGSTALTGTGVGIGTPEYMAPEQWVGNTSPQSDLYSLGVVLYEMLTGHKPFTAETPAAILLKQANDPLPRPRQFVPDLPERVEKIILKVLAKKSENRYASMLEFIAALENLLSGQTKKRHPAVSLEKLQAEISPKSEHELPLEGKQIGDQPTVVPLEKLKPEISLEPENERLVGQIPIGDQPTMIARLPAEVKPGEPVSPAIEAIKIRIPYPEIPPSEVKRLGKIDIRPAWIVALVGVVVVIALTIWGISALMAGFTHTPPAAVSPDMPAAGRYVYYTSNQSGKAEIYYLDPKAISHRVTQTPGLYQSWSPVPAADGYVYYTSDQSGKAEIYYLDSKAISHQVTQTPGLYQSWSPVLAADGYVYYTSDQSGKAEIYYLDVEAISHQVTQTSGLYQSWSPVPAANGYVYYTSDQSGKAEIYYLDSKAISHQVTQTPVGYQSWSPVPAAGGYVYYTSNQSGKAEVYYLDSKAISHQVTQTPGLYQSWSPVPAAGGYVYYTSDQSGKAEIYYLDPKAISHRVTQTPGLYQSWLKMFGVTPAITQP